MRASSGAAWLAVGPLFDLTVGSICGLLHSIGSLLAVGFIPGQNTDMNQQDTVQPTRDRQSSPMSFVVDDSAELGEMLEVFFTKAG